eukprot:scaffold218684_cov26-Tisochrysis_lutea.AAC.2
MRGGSRLLSDPNSRGSFRDLVPGYSDGLHTLIQMQRVKDALLQQAYTQCPHVPPLGGRHPGCHWIRILHSPPLPILGFPGSAAAAA